MIDGPQVAVWLSTRLSERREVPSKPSEESCGARNRRADNFPRISDVPSLALRHGWKRRRAERSKRLHVPCRKTKHTAAQRPRKCLSTAWHDAMDLLCLSHHDTAFIDRSSHRRELARIPSALARNAEINDPPLDPNRLWGSLAHRHRSTGPRETGQAPEASEQAWGPAKVRTAETQLIPPSNL